MNLYHFKVPSGFRGRIEVYENTNDDSSKIDDLGRFVVLVDRDGKAQMGATERHRRAHRISAEDSDGNSLSVGMPGASTTGIQLWELGDESLSRGVSRWVLVVGTQSAFIAEIKHAEDAHGRRP